MSERVDWSISAMILLLSSGLSGPFLITRQLHCRGNQARARPSTSGMKYFLNEIEVVPTTLDAGSNEFPIVLACSSAETQLLQRGPYRVQIALKLLFRMWSRVCHQYSQAFGKEQTRP